MSSGDSVTVDDLPRLIQDAEDERVRFYKEREQEYGESAWPGSTPSPTELAQEVLDEKKSQWVLTDKGYVSVAGLTVEIYARGRLCGFVPESFFDSAFQYFGDGDSWKNRIKPITRRAMVFVALNTDFDTNENKPQIDSMFGSNSGFQYSTEATVKVLREIKRLSVTSNKVEAEKEA